MIGGRYLVVKQWHPKFCATEETIGVMAVWIWIAGLSLDLLNVDFLTKVGNFMSSTSKVDLNTVEQGYGLLGFVWR